MKRPSTGHLYKSITMKRYILYFTPCFIPSFTPFLLGTTTLICEIYQPFYLKIINNSVHMDALFGVFQSKMVLFFLIIWVTMVNYLNMHVIS